MNTSKTLGSYLKAASKDLRVISQCPTLEAELLMCHVLSCKRSYLYTHNKEILENTAIKKLDTICKRRSSGEPLSQIRGYKEFWSSMFYVNQNVLTPRPESELLVELAIKNCTTNTKLLELGTGSGAISISIFKECPWLNITATDISYKAIQMAQKNAKINKSKINFVNCNWYKPFAQNNFDIILSNPPYLSKTEFLNNKDELQFEPESALVSYDEGLGDLKKIISGAKQMLSKKGMLFLEHSFNHAAKIKEFLYKQNFIEIKTYNDIAGHERVTSAKVSDG
ncbi:MAG: peptide chain release factor N(5)-glutamine methyltransferase [Pseudomonadota bacterium]